MSFPNGIYVQDCIAETDNFARDGKIDPTSHIKDDKVFILHGKEDPTVGIGKKNNKKKTFLSVLELKKNLFCYPKMLLLKYVSIIHIMEPL